MLTTLQKVLDHNPALRNNLELAEDVFAFADEAEDMVRKWIGDSKYEEIEASTSHTYYSKVQKAESLLAFGIALPSMGMSIREKGGLVKSTGFAESTNMLMGKYEVDSYSRNLFARARQQLRKLLIKSYNIDRPEYLDYAR